MPVLADEPVSLRPVREVRGALEVLDARPVEEPAQLGHDELAAPVVAQRGVVRVAREDMAQVLPRQADRGVCEYVFGWAAMYRPRVGVSIMTWSRLVNWILLRSEESRSSNIICMAFVKGTL